SSRVPRPGDRTGFHRADPDPCKSCAAVGLRKRPARNLYAGRTVSRRRHRLRPHSRPQPLPAAAARTRLAVWRTPHVFPVEVPVVSSSLSRRRLLPAVVLVLLAGAGPAAAAESYF